MFNSYDKGYEVGYYNAMVDFLGKEVADKKVTDRRLELKREVEENAKKMEEDYKRKREKWDKDIKDGRACQYGGVPATKEEWEAVHGGGTWIKT